MTDQRNHGPRDIDAPEGELDSGNEHSKDIAPDDRPNVKAMREAAREHSDAYMVKSDLEDQDQREAAPGTREQK